MPSETILEYADDLVAGLEFIWGDGFLSPGGPEEVAQLLEGIAVDGKAVLDIGCGLGGPSCALVEQHGAEHVVAIDIEEPVIQRARKRASARNLEGRIDFKVVSPGQLPFDDRPFDLVFSKEAFIHVEDKSALFCECFRVLRDGGWIVLSDWFCGNQPFSSEMEVWLEREAEYVTFHITTLDSTTSVLGDIGFANIASVGAPNFLRLNLSKGLISRKPPGGEEITSPIKRTVDLDGRLVLQGAETGIKGQSGGLGWTLSIDKQSGAMVLTGSGDGVAFVIFGACMIP